MSDPLDALPESVFPVDRAVTAGLTTSRARRSDLEAAGRGLRRRRGSPPDPLQTAIAHARRDRSLVLSHNTAAAVWGIWLPHGGQVRPHLARVRPGAPPRVKGAHGHRLRLDPERHVITLGQDDDAYSVTSPVRTWADLTASGLPVEDLVVAGDSLLRRADGPRGSLPRGWRHPLASRTAMWQGAEEWRGLRRWSVMREVLERVREGSDSPQETRLRLRLVEAGLPEPEVNPPVVLLRDALGRVLQSTSVDLFYERARLAIQYEGEHHFTHAAQYRRDMRRDEELRDAGVEVLRVDKEVFGPAEWPRFVERVARLLRQRGHA